MPATGEAAAPVPSYHLPLRSLRHASGLSDGAVLRHLSPNSLTKLELRMAGPPAARHDSKSLKRRSAIEAVDKLLGNLRCLTNLQSLSLGVDPTGAIRSKKQQLHGGSTMKALAGLSQLTELSLIVAVASTIDLQQLPVSLQQLQLWCFHDLHRDEQQPVLQLRQLSRLTSLAVIVVLRPPSRHQVFSLQAGDELPMPLQQLTVDCIVRQIDPMLQLQQLRELDVTHCTFNAVEAQRLTALASLTALSLRYGYVDANVDSEEEEIMWTPGRNSCCTWQQLPLVKLVLCMDVVVGPKAVQALGLATRLTHLRMGFCPVKTTEQQLALLLSKLQNLRQLWMGDLMLQPPQHDDVPGSNLLAHAGQDDADVSSGAEDDGGLQQLQAMEELSLQPIEVAADSGCALLAVAARLPVLGDLSLYGGMWSAAAMLELQVATQLTRLAIAERLSKNGMGDEVAVRLCSSLTGLRTLEINSRVLTEACLPALKHLQHLEQASLNHSQSNGFECEMFMVDGVLLTGVLRTGSGSGEHAACVSWLDAQLDI